jgi:ubiquitin C-terminal hydrolase
VSIVWGKWSNYKRKYSRFTFPVNISCFLNINPCCIFHASFAKGLMIRGFHPSLWFDGYNCWWLPKCRDKKSLRKFMNLSYLPDQTAWKWYPIKMMKQHSKIGQNMNFNVNSVLAAHFENGWCWYWHVAKMYFDFI